MKFTKRTIETIKGTEKRQTFFDDGMPGLALRVSTTGHKSFYYTYRLGKGRCFEKKWIQLGSFPTMTVEQARDKAKLMAASLQYGQDPARQLQENKEALDMKDALKKFQNDHIAKLKPQTQQSYTRLIEKLILPSFGKMRAKDVTYSDIANFHARLKKTPYQANRAYAVLSKFFNWCELCGYRGKNSNPCDGITKYKEQKRQNFMGAHELGILGETLSRMETTWHERQKTKEKRTAPLVDTITPQAAAVIRLLMFTGARVGEILSLEWANINLEEGIARLPDSKTGFKILQLTHPAVAVLKGIPQIDRWVFPSDSECGHMVNIKDAWGDVLKQANLLGWRLHDLRHAFASTMVNGGASLPIVGKILGHSNASTTQRYAHLEENPARKAAEQAASIIAHAIENQKQR